MNEKMLAERLERDIERLLDGRALPDDSTRDADYQQALEAAQMLAQHDMSPESRVRKSLRQNLLQRISTQRKVWSPREKGAYPMKPRTKSFVFVGILTAFLLTAMTLPPVRAFAQDLLKEIGPYIIVSETEVPWEEPPADFNPTPIPGGDGEPSEMIAATADPNVDPSSGPTPIPSNPNAQTLTPQEALTQLGFKALLPSYIPDGYALIVDPKFVHAVGDRISSSMVYTTSEDAYLQIAQTTFDDTSRFAFYVDDEKVIELIIRGQEGLFMEGGLPMTVLDENGNNVDIPLNCLMWEEGGHFFMMTASELTQAEMLKIAEGLK